jgi:acetate kinase
LILVVNFGSSSFKFKIFKKSNHKSIGDDFLETFVEGNCEKIGDDSGKVCYKTKNSKIECKIAFKDHRSAFFIVKNMLIDTNTLKDLNEISAIGHRIVHGGKYFKKPVLIKDYVIEKIRSLIPLAPIHNSANLEGILDCQEAFKNVPQFAVFDTSFFVNLPPEFSTFAIPKELSQKYEIKKYGFHGISHEWADFKYKLYKTKIKANNPAELNEKIQKNNFKIITCHLGSGSSISAIIDGKPIETSMGLTPLDGLVMGTRCGSIDPSIITYLMKNENFNNNEINEIMTKKSGLLGLSGISSDIRTVLNHYSNNKNCHLAINVFCNKIIEFIGAYIAIMNGCNAIVFTGGIGENLPWIRKKICKNFKFLGLKLDIKLNNKISDQGIISSKDSAIDIFVVCANEEKSIALTVENKINENISEFDLQDLCKVR